MTIQPLANGLIPEYEEREAALFGRYNWAAWSALPRDERVHGVAHYRLHHLVETHIEEVAMNESRRRAQEQAATLRSRSRGGRR